MPEKPRPDMNESGKSNTSSPKDPSQADQVDGSRHLQIPGWNRRKTIIVHGIAGLVLGLSGAILFNLGCLHLANPFHAGLFYLVITAGVVAAFLFWAGSKYDESWKGLKLDREMIHLESPRQQESFRPEELLAIVEWGGRDMAGNEVGVRRQLLLLLARREYTLHLGSEDNSVFHELLQVCPHAIGIPLNRKPVLPRNTDTGDHRPMETVMPVLVDTLNTKSSKRVYDAQLHLAGILFLTGIYYWIASCKLETSKFPLPLFFIFLVVWGTIVLMSLFRVVHSRRYHSRNRKLVSALQDWNKEEK